MSCKQMLATRVVAMACGLVAMNGLAAAQGDVRYRSGGVGQEQQEQMKQAASDYRLGVTFANPHGQYVAGVDVSIRDAQGKEVLSTNSGPMLLVDLPAGRYDVEARLNGQRQNTSVQVPAQGHRQVLLQLTPAPQ